MKDNHKGIYIGFPFTRCCVLIPPTEGVVFSRPGRYYAGGEWVELMYGTFTDYTG